MAQTHRKYEGWKLENKNGLITVSAKVERVVKSENTVVFQCFGGEEIELKGAETYTATTENGDVIVCDSYIKY